MYHSAVAAKPASRVHPALRAEAQLALEAAKARALGKTFVASILESLSRTLWSAPDLLRMIEDWPGDLASAGVIFRLNAGLHALARSGRYPQLETIYQAATPTTTPDPLALDLALVTALAVGEDALLRWLDGPTQTNEVGRVAGLVAVLMDLSAARAMPFSLLELGASAGLNLNLAHYAICLAEHCTGDTASDVRIVPRWSGLAPKPGPLLVRKAVGVDLNPIDLGRNEDAERLHAYIWPGERERSERLRGAIGLALRHPPMVEQGRAGSWLAKQLASPQPEGERRVVFHSMVLQYMRSEERQQIDQLISAAGASASAERPLVRVSLEWNKGRSVVEVRVTQWDGRPGSGRYALAARCHPYAEWFEWFGLGTHERCSDK